MAGADSVCQFLGKTKISSWQYFSLDYNLDIK